MKINSPHVTLATASWNNFDNQAVVNAGSTVFSSVAEIDTVYPPVAFTSDVDLTNTDAVKSFFNDNVTPLASQQSVPRYAVGTINESTAITQAYSALTGGYAMEPGYESATNLVMALDVSDINATDASSNGNHATVHNNTNGGLTVGEDENGKYLEFDGTTTSTDNTRIELDYELFKNTTSSANDPFTFDITFKVDDGYVIGSSDTEYPYICQGGTGRVYHYLSGSSYAHGFRFGSGGIHMNATGSFPLGSVQRHTWVYDGTTVTIYENGNIFRTEVIDFYGATQFNINVSPSTTTDTGNIPMKLYGVNVFQSALTEQQLQALWDQPSGAIAGQTVALPVSAGAVPVEASGNYQVIMAAQDVTGNVGLGELVSASSSYSPPEGPYQVWLYMLGNSSSQNNHNLVSVVRMYDTADAWDVSSPTTENGNLLSYTIDFNADYNNGLDPLTPPDAALNTTVTSISYYYDNIVSETEPVLKLSGVDASVKSIYMGWYRPKYAFDYRLELRTASGELISSQEDRSISGLTGNGDPTNVSTLLTAAHAEWNISLSAPSGGTFASLSTLNTSITSAAFDEETNQLTLSGEVTASDTEGATTSYKALATTQTGLSNTQVRNMMNNVEYADAVVTAGAPEGPYQLWVYMTKHDHIITGLENHNLLKAILMYDSPNGWGGGTVENGTRLSYTVEYANNKVVTNAANALVAYDADLTVTYSGVYYYFNDSAESTEEPILKLGNVDPSVRSVYLTWEQPRYAFDILLKLVDTNGNVISEFEDNTLTDLVDSGSAVPLSEHFDRVYSEWNIPDLISTSNMIIPKVLDANNQIVPAESVNYANVYLYGTDGTLANDAMAVKTIDPANLPPPLWNASASHWKVKVLSIHGEDISNPAFGNGYSQDDKILIGSLAAMGVPQHFAQLRILELALLEADGVFVTPTDITLTNSEGTQHTNVTQVQDNEYGSGQQLNGVITAFGLKNFIDIDYTFDSPKNIAQINIANPGLVGMPIDMEIYNSVDGGSTWIMHSRLSYQTGDMPDASGNFTNIYVGSWKTMLKYDAPNYRWYFDGSNNTDIGSFYPSENRVDIIISDAQNEYPYEGFNTPFVPTSSGEPDVNPHVTLGSASWNNFENQAVINAGSTVFSSVAEIDTVFPPVAFTSDVDLSNTEAVKTFFNDNITPLATQQNVPKYAVGTINESSAITQAYTGLKLLSEGQTAELSVRDVDWTAITPNTPDFDLSSGTHGITTNGYYGMSSSVSADGKTALVAGRTDFTKGSAFVWEYNDSSNQWGKYTTSGFVQGVPHNLSKLSGTKGQYGQSCALSADGKTALLAGRDGLYGGCAWIWKYDETNKVWGVAGEPDYDLSGDYGTGTSAGNYGTACALSADGNTALITAMGTDLGFAFFLTFVDGTWTMVHEYYRERHTTISTENVNMGGSCALSADGKTALVAGYGSADRGGAVILTYDAASNSGLRQENSGRPPVQMDATVNAVLSRLTGGPRLLLVGQPLLPEVLGFGSITNLPQNGADTIHQEHSQRMPHTICPRPTQTENTVNPVRYRRTAQQCL